MLAAFFVGMVNSKRAGNMPDLPKALAACRLEDRSSDSAGEDAGYSARYSCAGDMAIWRQTLVDQLDPKDGWQVDQEYLDFIKSRNLVDVGDFAYVKLVDGTKVAQLRGGATADTGAVWFRFKQYVDEDKIW